MMSANTITRSVEIGLRVVGIWPGASYAIISRLFWTATMLAAQIFQYRHVALHLNSEDLSRLMDGLSATLSYSLLFVKLIFFWTKQRYVVVNCRLSSAFHRIMKIERSVIRSSHAVVIIITDSKTLKN
jgi:hypothetical protein